MPITSILFYQDENGAVPVVKWLGDLKHKDPKGFAKCVGRIRQLGSVGYELRRPAADYLREGIYELRVRHKNLQYRMLYFFSGKDIAVLSHSIVKKTSAVPKKEIELAIDRKKTFEKNPERHTYRKEVADDD
ncbi:MAG: type II toxin-antitoxin system RelE/ParE family toxin [Phormidesmis sp.]